MCCKEVEAAPVLTRLSGVQRLGLLSEVAGWVLCPE
jgi:hypothetical protein